MDSEINEEELYTSEKLLSAQGKNESEVDTEELIEFRRKWKAEITTAHENAQRTEMVKETKPFLSIEDSMTELTTVCDVVPDPSTTQNKPSDVDESSDVCALHDMNEIIHDTAKLQITKELLCKPLVKQKGCHISALPLEIFHCILSFAVLPDLDLRTLEQFGMVCKGFYVLAREKIVWKKSCFKLWGNKCSPQDYQNDWRLLYLSCPHIHFNGVYISQSSYVRNGEQSLDKLYRPFHLVFYYRYLRFFTNGSVLYLTSPQEPSQVVSQLKQENKKDGVMFGEYTQSGDVVRITVSKPVEKLLVTKAHSQKSKNKHSSSDHSEHLQMEFEIRNNTRCLMSILKWKKFSHQSIQKSPIHVQTTDFDIDRTYRPFKFSYTTS